MPTKLRRHAITETAPVKEALDELRRELGTDRVPLGELVVLGAHEKLARLRAEDKGRAATRRRLAERIAAGDLGVDRELAESVRRTGWTSHV